MEHGPSRRDELPLAILLQLNEPLSTAEILDGMLQTFVLEPTPTRAIVAVVLAALAEENLVAACSVDGVRRFKRTRSGAMAAHARAHRQPIRRRGGLPAKGNVAVLFTDVVGSTMILDKLGPRAGFNLMKEHFSVLRAVTNAHEGHVVKALGDGLLVVFADPAKSVDCAVEMQHAVASDTPEIAIRIGIDVGDPVRDDGDVFGRPVIVARRLCDAAGAGQILVTDGVRALACANHELELLGPLPLKGMSECIAAATLRTKPSRRESSPTRDLVSVCGA